MSPRPVLADNVFEAVTATPTTPQPTAAAPRRRKAAAPTTTAATVPAHRVGTIAAPYTRQDGVAVRQWSATLPVYVVEALQIASIQERRRPADIVADLIAAHCNLQPAAAPVVKPRAVKTAKSKPKTAAKPKTRKR
jgi:hypothetical protein